MAGTETGHSLFIYHSTCLLRVRDRKIREHTSMGSRMPESHPSVYPSTTPTIGNPPYTYRERETTKIHGQTIISDLFAQKPVDEWMDGGEIGKLEGVPLMRSGSYRSLPSISFSEKHRALRNHQATIHGVRDNFHHSTDSRCQGITDIYVSSGSRAVVSGITDICTSDCD